MDGLDNAVREIAELVEENKRLREGLEGIRRVLAMGHTIREREADKRAKEALEG